MAKGAAGHIAPSSEPAETHSSLTTPAKRKARFVEPAEPTSSTRTRSTTETKLAAIKPEGRRETTPAKTSVTPRKKKTKLATREKRSNLRIVTEDDGFDRPSEKEFNDPRIYAAYRSFQLDLPGQDLTKEEKTFFRGDFIFVRPGGVIGRPANPSISSRCKRKIKSRSGGQPGPSRTREVNKSGEEGSELEDGIGGSATEGDDSDDQQEDAEGEVWLAQVERIRARSPIDVWLNVKWLYTSVGQLRGEGCRNIPPVIARNEVIMCDGHEDVINAQTVDGHANVYQLNDTTPISEHHIRRHNYWYRSEFMIKDETGVKKGYKPYIRPIDETGNATCPICDMGYFPIPSDPDSQQIFCASEGCGIWTHVTCLAQPVPATAETLARLEITGLDDNGHVDLAGYSDDHAEIETWGKCLASQNTDVSLEEVLAFARSSIMRGGRYGIEGNGLDVLGGRMELWARRHRGDEDDAPGLSDGMTCRKCPTCKGAI